MTRSVTREQFARFPKVVGYERELATAVQETLDSVSTLADIFGDSPWHRLEEISVVAAGGGARLPVVMRLASGWRQVGRHRYAMKHVGYAPSWFANYYPDEALAFPQLAVALGGASPKFPKGAPEPTGIYRRGRI